MPICPTDLRHLLLAPFHLLQNSDNLLLLDLPLPHLPPNACQLSRSLTHPLTEILRSMSRGDGSRARCTRTTTHVLIYACTQPRLACTWPNNLAHDRQFIARIDSTIAPCNFDPRNV
jgi:hypothetical protein